jgi:hypothetical protein
LSVCPVQSTPAGPRAPDQYGAAAWPLVCVKQRLPRKVFRRSIAGLSGSLSVLHQSRPFSEEMPDLYPTSLPTRRTGDIRWSVMHPTDVSSAPDSGLDCRHAASRVAVLPPTLVCDGAARVAPICCLGRIVPSTTVELAAWEIAPIGLVWPLDTTLDAPEPAPRQLTKGGPTDRCLRGERDPYPPFF